MKFNIVAPGIELVGATIKNLTVKNDIVDIEKDAKRSFGLTINEPYFETDDNGIFSIMNIDFEIEVEQSEKHKFIMELSLEGAFLSQGSISEKKFKQLVAVNGAAAIIGIARGKIETLTANIYKKKKIVIPFVNIIDYYKSME